MILLYYYRATHTRALHIFSCSGGGTRRFLFLYAASYAILYPWHERATASEADERRRRCVRRTGQSAARNGAGGRQEQHRVVVGGVRRWRRQPQRTAEGMLPEAGGVHVHASWRRRVGGRLRGGGRVLLHTDRGTGGRRAATSGRAAPAQLFGERVERHQHVQRAQLHQLEAPGKRRAQAL